MTEVAVKCDLGSLFGAARDQGDRPTCLAFAASDAHAALRAGWEPLSCEYAFYQAQRRSNRPPKVGARLPDMLDALRDDGQPQEKDGPISIRRLRTVQTGARRMMWVKSIAVSAPSDLKASMRSFSRSTRGNRS